MKNIALRFLVLFVAVSTTHTGFAINPTKFLWEKTAVLPGKTLLESCRIRFGESTVLALRPGRGNTVVCKVRFEAALDGRRVNNFK